MKIATKSGLIIIAFLFQIGICNSAFAQVPPLQFVNRIPGQSTCPDVSIDIDKSGNVYSIGEFKGAVDFDPGPGHTILSADSLNYSLFLTKTDGAGNLIWARSFGMGFSTSNSAIHVDQNYNIYASYWGNFSKWDSSGTNLWTTSVSAFNPGVGSSIKTDVAGRIYLTGAINNRIAIIKANNSGNIIWNRILTSTSTSAGTSLYMDDDCNIIYTGFFGGTTDFDPGPLVYNLPPIGTENLFVSKLDSASNFIFAYAIGGGFSPIRGISIYLDNSSNIFVAGGFRGTVDFDPGPGVYNLTVVSSTSCPFLMKLDSAANFVWANAIVPFSGGYGSCTSIYTKSNGNIVVSGYTSGLFDFDPGPGVIQGNNRILFFAMYDSVGNFISLREFEGTFGVTESKIDTLDNVYFAGCFLYSAEVIIQSVSNKFFPGSNTKWDICYGKIDSQFEFEYAKQFTGSNILKKSLYTDASGVCYSAGNFGGFIDFSFGAGTQYSDWNQRQSGYVAKNHANGSVDWVKVFNSSLFSSCEKVLKDDAGNIYVIGNFRDTIDADPGQGIYYLTSDFSTNGAFVVKLDSVGNFIWAKAINGATNFSFVISPQHDLYITGLFTDTVDFDPGPSINNLVSDDSDNDVFLLKLDSAGNFIYAFNYGDNADLEFPYVALDNSGNIVIAGQIEGTADFDPGPTVFNISTLGGGFTVYVAKYTSAGNFLWAKSYYDYLMYLNALSIDHNSNMILSGYFFGAIDVDLGPGIFLINNVGGYDGYVCKMDSSGNFIWTRPIATVDHDYVYGSVVDLNGNIYLSYKENNTGYLSKWDSAGTTIWTGEYVNAQFSKFLTLDGADNLYASGTFLNTVDFDATATDHVLIPGGLYDEFTMKIGNGLTGIENITTIDDILIYPNPTDGLLYFNDPGMIISRIELYDLQGRLLKMQTDNATHNPMKLDGYSQSLYYLKMKTAKGVITKKVSLVR